MAKEDYASASTGGALKLKGAKPAGIDKKRKKDKSKKSQNKAENETMKQTNNDGAENEGGVQDVRDEEMERLRGLQKTEAERRHDELRRRRLDDRLRKEGVKTHKERVEELNKYLSNLSEHHDMPRIGPG